MDICLKYPTFTNSVSIKSARGSVPSIWELKEIMEEGETYQRCHCPLSLHLARVAGSGSVFKSICPWLFLCLCLTLALPLHLFPERGWNARPGAALSANGCCSQICVCVLWTSGAFAVNAPLADPLWCVRASNSSRGPHWLIWLINCGLCPLEDIARVWGTNGVHFMRYPLFPLNFSSYWSLFDPNFSTFNNKLPFICCF